MGSGAFLIRQLPQDALDELGRKVPDFPEFFFVRAVSAYIDARDEVQPTQKVIRDELNLIEKKADELCRLLAGRSQALSDYLHAREMQHGANGLIRGIIPDLRNLIGIAKMAWLDAEAATGPGRNRAARTELVEELAGALKEAGINVTAKPQGPLVLAFGIALRAAGEEIADPAKTVASALNTLGAKQ